MKTHCCYATKIGCVGIEEEDGAVTRLWFAGENEADAGAADGETPLLREAASQLRAYLDGARTAFDLPLAPAGTPFQKLVWEALRAIPYGETRSYAQIAEAVGSPKGFRAVGMANNRNPIAVIVPCHRVIGADGSLTGYAGGLAVKSRLLALEREGRLCPK